jgi:hypothetical protein
MESMDAWPRPLTSHLRTPEERRGARRTHNNSRVSRVVRARQSAQGRIDAHAASSGTRAAACGSVAPGPDHSRAAEGRHAPALHPSAPRSPHPRNTSTTASQSDAVVLGKMWQDGKVMVQPCDECSLYAVAFRGRRAVPPLPPCAPLAKTKWPERRGGGSCEGGPLARPAPCRGRGRPRHLLRRSFVRRANLGGQCGAFFGGAARSGCA